VHLTDSISHLKNLEDMSRQMSFIHRLHAVAKLLVCMIFIIIVVSFDKDNPFLLLPLFLYPFMVMSLADIPFLQVIRRLIIVEPVIIAISLGNVFFDRHPVLVVGMEFTHGWIVFLSFLIKGTLTVLSAILLVSTTGLDKIAKGLRMIHVPKLLVLQIVMTVRYIVVLAEEINRMVLAYSLRNGGKSHIRQASWGALMGNLLLRSYGKACRIHEAMQLRGFNGEYHLSEDSKQSLADVFYMAFWIIFLVIIRFTDYTSNIGTYLIGLFT